jgi:NTE family protein
MKGQPTLGIALGSGAARGWAHIGILRALADVGIAPDLVAGCSMGAMVGAAFAAGRVEQLEAWALSLDGKGVVGMLDIGLRGGLFKGHRLLDHFHRQFASCQFSELELPFAAVAADLASGQEVWLREGKVSDAVHASCAIPGLFQPVPRDGRYLIDGSVVNPIPVSLCRAMGADVVIAVDLGSNRGRRFARGGKVTPGTSSYRRRLMSALLRRRDDDSAAASARKVAPLPSMIDALLGAIEIMQERTSEQRLATEPPDVLLIPRLQSLGPFEYHRAAAAIAEGREAVALMLPAIHASLAGWHPATRVHSVRGARHAAFTGTSAHTDDGAGSAIGAEGATMKFHKPPKQDKKKPLLSPKEKKAAKQQKKHAADVAPLIKH